MQNSRFKRFFFLYLILSGPILSASGDTWGGIPSRRRPVTEKPPKTNEEEETQKPQKKLGEQEKSTQITKSGQLLLKNETDTAIEGDNPFSDFDWEWEIFDDSTSKIGQETAETDHPGDISWKRLALQLAWPILFFLVFLVICLCFSLVCCLTRRQVFCCGLPFFDSTREAAHNYDRASLRKENRRRSRMGLPDERPTLEDHELRKLATLVTCLLYTSPSPRDRQKSRMPSSA